MSEEAKKLLLRLKKEKKIDKQIDLIKDLKDYNREDMVNHVLLKHLERKDLDNLRLEILASLNPEDDKIIKPLSQLISDKYEQQVIVVKAINLLGQNKSSKALGVLLSASRKIKDTKILDNIISALALFEDKKVVKPIIKALNHDDLRLNALTGLARNENLLLSSINLIKEIVNMNITKSFEKLHFEKIIDTISAEFGYSSKKEIIAAIENKSINKKIDEYSRKQEEINRMLKKVDHK
jgi:HEAT repeat protein